ncbi:uracil-DNA glycosylase [Aquirufa rosea]|uniref:Uracil-DNA glycosylase n=2 Tax=Aquirufa rosea TaxID=2509241 RepID=A0A4Q1C356_9BACT|nr:uracil-DNA glycosylase [Aquirufa rosea]
MDQNDSKIARNLTDLLMNDWKNIFLSDLGKAYFDSLGDQLIERVNSEKVFPPLASVFQAFNLCSFEDTQVVLIGQDPYHGPGQAHGLCFSVPNGIALPPSLKNIKKELHQDLDVWMNHESGDLTHWAKQGVLMLNTILTVSEDKPGSHAHLGWQQLTSFALDKLNTEKEHLVFLLWGAHAQKLASSIDRNKHLLLEAAHPSPLSANRGGWFGNHHFSKTNEYLLAHDKKPIQWL